MGLSGLGRSFSSAEDADVAFNFTALEAQPAGMASYPPVGSQVCNHRPEPDQPEEIWTKDIYYQ